MCSDHKNVCRETNANLVKIQTDKTLSNKLFYNHITNGTYIHSIEYEEFDVQYLTGALKLHMLKETLCNIHSSQEPSMKVQKLKFSAF